MMTVSSGRITTQAFTSGGAPLPCASAEGSCRPSARPPPVAAEIFRKSRRVVMAISSGAHLLRRGVNRSAYARVGAAATNVRHCFVDVLVRGIRLFLEKRHGGEDLPALAIAALRHLIVDPRLLHGMQFPALDKPFDPDDAFACRAGNRERARAHRLAIHMHRAGAALRDATAELRTLDIELVPQHPQERHLRLDV